MKIALIGAVALLGIALPSCQKDDVVTSTVTGKKLVKETSTGYHKDVVNYSYDTQGRMTKVNYSQDQYSLEYNGNTVTIKDFRPAENKEVYHATATTDAGKKLSALTADCAFVADKKYISNTIFVYNAEGYLTKKEDSRSDGNVYTVLYSWANGNMVKTEYFKNTVFQYKQLFTYHATADLTGVDHYKFDCAVTGLVGKKSKQLIKKITTYFPNEQLENTLDYTYTLDAEGYPVKAVLKHKDGEVTNIEYTYIK